MNCIPKAFVLLVFTFFYSIGFSQDNQLKVQSNYKILNNVIPNENLEELKILNEQVKMVKNKRIIVKLKGV